MANLKQIATKDMSARISSGTGTTIVTDLIQNMLRKRVVDKYQGQDDGNDHSKAYLSNLSAKKNLRRR